MSSDKFNNSIQHLQDIIRQTNGDGTKLKAAWPQLKGVKASLDSGKAVTGAGKGRGLPLSIVVQILKSSWHYDDTWPVESKDVVNKAGAAPLEAGPPARPDPSPQDIAQMYRDRGVDVQEVTELVDDW